MSTYNDGSMICNCTNERLQHFYLFVCLFFAYLFHMFSLVNIDIMIVNGILLG